MKSVPKPYPNGEKQHIVSPETIKLDVYYSITICPDDSRQFWKNEVRDMKVHGEYRNYIFSNYDISEYHVVLYQELSRTGRIHYHGKIKFLTMNSIHKFYLKQIHILQEYNIIEIDTIKDDKVWEEYITKYNHLRCLIIDNKLEVHMKSLSKTIMAQIQ